MATKDLEGKGLTIHDVVRQALEPRNLGPDADAQDVRNWAEWKFPMVNLPEEHFDETVETVRHEMRKECE